MPRRAVVIVLDSVGIGALPDAERFGDVGSDTLGHICEVAGAALPNMARWGLGNIRPFHGIEPAEEPIACYGKMAEVADGKDTTTGHWEMMGIMKPEPFQTFPDGFSDEIIEAFCANASLDGVLANKPASGTVVIQEYGEEHERTGKPIVYTSADPVFQIAAHESVIPIDRLYELCEIAYDIMAPRGISRIIARPFVGAFPNYERTYRRRDFAVPPESAKGVLDHIVDAGLEVTGIGKISQIYAGHGITREIKSKNNADGIQHTIDVLANHPAGFVFTNLVDFDMKFGHRRNPDGYARALEAFDVRLPEIMDALGEDDVLILTADHGNDPTYPGTDHTREYVPLLVWGPRLATGCDLGTKSTFADLGATVAAYLGVDWQGPGESFLGELT